MLNIPSQWTPILLPFMILLQLSCGSSTDNKQVIERPTTECTLCPEIEAGQDTLNFVNDVRRFIAKNADTGLIENEVCDTFARIPIEYFPVDDYLTLFENDEGVASCGLAGTMMVKILLENGIDAYTYNFGFKDTELSHIIVLVKQSGKLLVFDPYMNYELLDENGNNLDLLSMLAAIGENKLKVGFSQDTVIADMNVDFKLLTEVHRQMVNRPGCQRLFGTKTLIRDSVYKIPRLKCFECAADASCESFVRRFEETLRVKTNLQNFHEGFALKIHEVYGASDYQEIDDQISTFIYSQPNLAERLNGKLVH